MTVDKEARRTELFDELKRSGSPEARNELAESYQPLAVHLAKRYTNRGVEQADLNQVANVGLLNAIDRFDPDFGANFASFAGQTIGGELKRHFRDKAWSVRVPRSIKESSALVRRAVDELEGELGRSPTVDQVAEHTGLPTEDVIEALDVSSAYRPTSLDQPARTQAEGDAAPSLADRIPADKQPFKQATDRMAVEALLSELDEQERSIVELTFYGELTQSQIAERHGISQMQVSRLLRRSLQRLQQQNAEDI